MGIRNKFREGIGIACALLSVGCAEYKRPLHNYGLTSVSQLEAVAEEPSKDFVKGDVNGDSIFDINDVVYLSNEREFYSDVADMNYDGRVNTKDKLIMLDKLFDKKAYDEFIDRIRVVPCNNFEEFIDAIKKGKNAILHSSGSSDFEKIYEVMRH